MFSSEHFIWIGLCAFFIAALLFISLKKSFPLRLAGYIMCGICVVSEISKMMSDLTEGVDGGMVLSPSSLPFHLCSLLLFGVFYVTFAKDTPARQAVIDFMSVAGIIGSICAILIPTNGTDFADIGAYQCFVYHAGLLWFALYLLCSGNARLGRRAFVRNMLFLLALVLLNFYTNSVLSAFGADIPEDDFAKNDKLSVLTATDIPEPIEALKGKTRRFGEVIDRDEMRDAICKYLGI